MKDNPTTLQNKLVVFQNKNIRRIWHNEEWFYSVVDICSVLTDSNNPRDYWYRVKKRLDDEAKSELSIICRQLKMEAPDGKMRTTDCADSKGIFRISTIHSFTQSTKVAGNARKETEKELGRSIISKQKFLDNDDKMK